MSSVGGSAIWVMRVTMTEVCTKNPKRHCLSKDFFLISFSLEQRSKIHFYRPPRILGPRIIGGVGLPGENSYKENPTTEPSMIAESYNGRLVTCSSLLLGGSLM